MAEIVEFPGDTKLPADPAEILEKAKAWGLERVLILGFKEDGEFAYGGSHCDIGESVLLLEIGKARLVRQADTIDP